MNRPVSPSPSDRGTPPVDVLPAPLPALAYSDQRQFEKEMSHLWATNWVFIGPRQKLPKSRGFMPVTVAGKSVLVTVEGGQLRAFHNVCAHRGCELASARLDDRSSISCPYHAWVYGADGALRSARDFAGQGSNHVPPSGDAVTALAPVRIEEWFDFVFVNLDNSAEPLTRRVLPIQSRWSHVSLDQLQHSATLEYSFEANWKLIAENFLESYHVPFLHQKLNTYSPALGRYQIQLQNDVNGIGTQPFEGVMIDGKGLPEWPSTSVIDYAEYFHMPPNLLLGIMPDHLFAWSLEPDGPDRTREVLHFYFHGEGASGEEFSEHRRQTLERWTTVNDEDHNIVQRMHRGLKSGAFERAQLSPVMEKNILRFQTMVQREVGK